MSDKPEKKSLWRGVGLPALFAILGFLWAYALVCGFGTSGSPYSELVLSGKKEAVNRHLQGRKQALSVMAQHAKGDTLKRTINLANKTTQELFALHHGNADTGTAYWLRYFFIQRDALSSALLDSAPAIHYLPFQTRQSIRIQSRDTLLVPVPIFFFDSASVLSDTSRATSDTLQLSQYTYSSKTAFFREHTPFTLWMVFSIAQTMLWFLLAPLILFRLKQNTGELVALGVAVPRRDFYASLIIPGAALLTFLIVFFFFLVDRFVVFDHYFLRHFKLREALYLLPVYVISGVYFGAFLFVAKQVQALKAAKEVNPALEVGNAVQSLKVTFSASFLCAAINLSLAVIWMGILYSAINTMEAPRFYRAVSGQPLISHDLVYLTGALHSVLLLIFYLPVKLLFDQEKGLSAVEEENAKLTEGLRKTVVTFLVTASPLLSAFLQKVVSGLFAS